MASRFSDRIGVTKPPSTLQVGEINDALRNQLWNFVLQCLRAGDTTYGGPYSRTCWEQIVRAIGQYFLKLPLDTLPIARDDSATKWLRGVFFDLPWYQVYNLIEFLVVDVLPDVYGFPARRPELSKVVNGILAEELSGYRFVDGTLAPITNQTEIDAIEEAATSAAAHGLQGVHEHIRTALSLIGQKPSPDYRNSVKESISAVEAAAKAISDQPKATLSPALEKLGTRMKLHPALKEGFQKLYGYTSDASGIRHALMEEPTLDLDDAKFMLVSCSAFATFLISKAATAGLIKAHS